MKSSTNLCGIYKITNIINGKFYIGSSIDINRRWKEHLKLLRNFKHTNPHLQSSWEKYDDEDIFKLSIVEECTKHMLLEREQFYIDTTKCYIRTIGYNICKIAGKGPDCTGLRQYQNMKQVNQYNLDGKYIKSFKCAKDVKLELGIANETISGVCNGRVKSAGGFMWTHGELPLKEISSYIRKRGYKKTGNRTVPIYQYDLNGIYLKEYKSTKEANILYSGANCSAYNPKQRKTAQGYQWRLYKTDKIEPIKEYSRYSLIKIYQYDLNRKILVIHNNANDAANNLPRKPKSASTIIRDVSNGLHNHKAYGFIWSRHPLPEVSSAPQTIPVQCSLIPNDHPNQ